MALLCKFPPRKAGTNLLLSLPFSRPALLINTVVITAADQREVVPFHDISYADCFGYDCRLLEQTARPLRLYCLGFGLRPRPLP